MMKVFVRSLRMCAIAAGLCGAPVEAGVVTFGDLSLAPESYWNGPDTSGTQSADPWGGTLPVWTGSFSSGGAQFSNRFNENWGNWSGFAYSNTTDTTTEGYLNQFSSYAGSGHGDANYGMAFGYADGLNPATAADLAGLPVITLPAGAELLGAYVTNATYAALSMLFGDGFAKQFGGPSGNDEDWFKLTAYGVDSNGVLLGQTAEFYLADYRFSDNSLDYLVQDWTWFDLSDLSGASQIYFNVSSSDVGQYGLNTPGYFAIDDLTFRDTSVVPEPGSLALACCAGLGLLGTRFRRRVRR